MEALAGEKLESIATSHASSFGSSTSSGWKTWTLVRFNELKAQLVFSRMKHETNGTIEFLFTIHRFVSMGRPSKKSGSHDCGNLRSTIFSRVPSRCFGTGRLTRGPSLCGDEMRVPFCILHSAFCISLSLSFRCERHSSVKRGNFLGRWYKRWHSRCICQSFQNPMVWLSPPNLLAPLCGSRPQRYICSISFGCWAGCSNFHVRSFRKHQLSLSCASLRPNKAAFHIQLRPSYSFW